MKLTQQQLDQYQTNGYLVVQNLVPAEELAPLRQRIVEISEGDHDWPVEHFHILDPSRIRNSKGDAIPFGLQRPALREAKFDAIAHHENVQTAMSQLLDGPVELFTDQVIMRHGSVRGGNSFYHQDAPYWGLPPRTGCNAWITLDEVGPGAGALAILPGTQRDWQIAEHEEYFDDPTVHNARTGQAFQRQRIPAHRIDFSQEDLLSLQPGDAVFFTNYTWHRAEGNMSGQHKSAYAIAYKTVTDRSK